MILVVVAEYIVHTVLFFYQHVNPVTDPIGWLATGVTTGAWLFGLAAGGNPSQSAVDFCWFIDKVLIVICLPLRQLN